MRHQLLFFVSLFTFFACNSNSSSSQPSSAEAPDIQVTVAGASPGTALLIGMFTDQQYRVDSSAIDANGAMRFTNEEPYKAGYYFVYLPDKQTVQLLIDKDQTFSMTTQSGNVVEAMQVEGSLDNDLFYQNLKFEKIFQPKVRPINTQLQNLPEDNPNYAALKAQQEKLIAERKAHLDNFFNNHSNSFFSQFKKAGQNPEVADIRNSDGSIDKASQIYLYRKQLWDNVDFNDIRFLYTPIINNKLQRYIVELTPQNPDSIIAATDYLVAKVLDKPEYYKFIVNWIALKYEPTKTTLMDPEAVFVHMIQNYFTYERATWSDSTQVFALQQRSYEMAQSLVGKKGPDVQATNPQGQTKSIYELTSPYIIVYLYNPTCDHCIEESPKLVQFYQQWKNRGLDVYAIAIDTDTEEWVDFITRNGMTQFTNVFDPTNKSIYGKYYVDNTPEIYVLNPDRMIIGKNLKVSQIEEIINRDKG